MCDRLEKATTTEFIEKTTTTIFGPNRSFFLTDQSGSAGNTTKGASH